MKVLLQSETVVTKWDWKNLSQNVTEVYYKVHQVLRSMAEGYYKVRQVLQSLTEIYYKVCQVLQSVTVCYYKVPQVLQSVTFITKWDVNKSFFQYNSCNIYFFKVNHRNTTKRCEICSKLTIKTPERRHWDRSGVFIVNFEHISHLFLVLLLLTLNVCWEEASDMKLFNNWSKIITS